MKNNSLISVITLAILMLQVTFNATAQIPDSLFGNNSYLVADAGGAETFSKFLLQPDGKIVAGGWDSDASGFYHNIMIRFDRCGLIDSTFGTNGIVKHRFDQRNIAYTFALQADGKFLCGGIQAPSNAGSQQIPFVARYHYNGEVDTTFANLGTHSLRFDLVSSGKFHTVIPMTDGRILCGGICSANANGGVHGLGAMRFLGDGSLDTTFNLDGKATYNINTSYMPSRARILQNGDIIVAGRYLDAGSNAHFIAVCFDSTGTLNTSFAVAGVFTDTVTLKNIYADAYMDMQADEKIVMACTREPVSAGIEVIRFTPSGIVDNTFGTNGHVNLTFAGMECKGINVLSNGKIMVLGEAGIGGCVVQLLPGGGIDSSFAVNGFLTVDLVPSGSDYAGDALEMPGNRFLFGGANSNHYIRRYAMLSNVPHITGDATLLQTTGGITYQWFLNNTAIALATTSTYVPLVDGNYTVQVTDDLGCTYLSEIFTVTGVGIIEHSSNATISIYPNPVNTELIVKSSGIITGIMIFDMMGKEIWRQENLKTSNFLLQTISLAKGVYFIEIVSGDEKTIAKFSKQ